VTSDHSDVRAYLEVVWRCKILVLAFVVVSPTSATRFRSSSSSPESSRSLG